MNNISAEQYYMERVLWDTAQQRWKNFNGKLAVEANKIYKQYVDYLLRIDPEEYDYREMQRDTFDYCDKDKLWFGNYSLPASYLWNDSWQAEMEEKARAAEAEREEQAKREEEEAAKYMYQQYLVLKARFEGGNNE